MYLDSESFLWYVQATVEYSPPLELRQIFWEEEARYGTAIYPQIKPAWKGERKSHTTFCNTLMHTDPASCLYSSIYAVQRCQIWAEVDARGWDDEWWYDWSLFQRTFSIVLRSAFLAQQQFGDAMDRKAGTIWYIGRNIREYIYRGSGGRREQPLRLYTRTRHIL